MNYEAKVGYRELKSSVFLEEYRILRSIIKKEISMAIRELEIALDVKVQEKTKIT